MVDTWVGRRTDTMASVYYKLPDEDSQKFMVPVPPGTGKSATDADKTQTDTRVWTMMNCVVVIVLVAMWGLF